MQAAKLGNLTFARLAAALLVICHHATNVLQDPAVVTQGWLRLFFSNGYVGVTFFFILSGFVISASSFEKLRVPTLDGVLVFFARRVFRIVPVWLFLSLLFVLPAFLARPIPLSVYRYLTFTQAWSADESVAFGYLSVAWTLSCEMFFYAMFPLTAVIMGRMQRFRHAGTGLMIFAVLVPLCAYLFFALHSSPPPLDGADPSGPHRWLYRNPAIRFSEFLLGVGMFMCFAQHAAQLRRAGQRGIWIGILVASIVALVALMSLLPISPLTLTLAYIVPFALIVFSLAAIEINEKPLAISAPLLLLLGEASYSLYLVHQQYGLALFERLFDARLPRVWLACTIVLTVALSIGLYKSIEMPFRNLLARYLERRRTRRGEAILPARSPTTKTTSRLPSNT